ncbi:hypothetical protein [Thalassobacillus sp. C254]|uniref:hypothetical protein n=1 Tax=Thalassobacillus sp. C254 TaxID=1225341 RepID=UPI0006D08B61|nr:hypothetical protein [Thalassobacillus sp. C254]
MKKVTFLFAMLIIFLLAGCGNDAGVEEEIDYETYRDTINSEEFTGFTYLLRTFRAEDGNYISDMESVFNNSNEQLYYINMQTIDDEVRDNYNEDSRNMDLYFPADRVAYIEDGHVIDEFEVSDDIHSSGHNNDLANFIQMYQ